MEEKIIPGEMPENVVEQTTEESVVVEEPVKTYTDAELNEILAKKIARKEAKIRKEYEEKYSPYKEAESVLNAGLGTSNIREATSNLREFYKQRGVKIPEHQPEMYSADDMKILASHEAQKIIDLGIEDVIEEVDRLADKGLENMTPKEKLVFTQLAEHRRAEEDRTELAKIGVKAEALNDPDFMEFAADLNPNMSMKDKYQKYLKYKPKKGNEIMGSMKSATSEETGVKEFYSHEEAMKFTREDFKKNPALLKAVENSMPKWSRK